MAHGMINRNMGCIEMTESSVLSLRDAPINRNMGCIEIEKTYEEI